MRWDRGGDGGGSITPMFPSLPTPTPPSPSDALTLVLKVKKKKSLRVTRGKGTRADLRRRDGWGDCCVHASLVVRLVSLW